MPLPALLLVIATLLPLVGFGVLLFVGKRMGNPLAGFVGTALIGASFLFSAAATYRWIDARYDDAVEWGAGKRPISLLVPWIPTGPGVNQGTPGFLDLGVYVDSLTLTMFVMVTLVATLVHVFSIGYMAADRRFDRFFTYLGLFCFSMLGLVLGGTTLQIFIFWELVGLCSYLLIGFWYEKRAASNAAFKAFLVNRVGDFGFLIGFGILFYHLGNVTLIDMWQALGSAGGGGAITLPGGAVFGAGLLTIAGIGLFFGAIGKSAQFPLHVWLPDAMEGPTPVSALIHAATMVAAGVYLVGRIFPILTPDAKLFIAIVGCVTLTIGALIASAQTDIKRVLAYSTISQLGYMILAMGVGSWIGGLFHLVTHAFFKALLFLGAGSVIHAAGHEQEMGRYGGLIRKIPVTGFAFLVAVLAIAGTPLLSGYHSKDTILADAGAFAALATGNGGSRLYWALWLLPTLVAYLTAFYMMRCFTLTFLGKPRNVYLYARARERWGMWLPLVALAIPSLLGGYIGVQTMLRNTLRETQAVVGPAFRTAWQGKASGEMGYVAPPEQRSTSPRPDGMRAAPEQGHRLTARYVTPAFGVGLALGLILYLPGFRLARGVAAVPPFGWLRDWLYHRMYFDELYHSVFVGVTVTLSRLCAWFDRAVVDGLVNLSAWAVRKSATAVGLHDRYVVDGAVNGVAELAQSFGAVVRAPQSGRIRLYVMVLMVVVALGLAAAILAVLS